MISRTLCIKSSIATQRCVKVFEIKHRKQQEEELKRRRDGAG